MTDLDQALARYATVFEQLTPNGLWLLHDVMARNVRFRDPFNAVEGIDHVEAIFAHMFETCAEVHFRVQERMRRGPRGMLLWTMDMTLRGGRSLRIEGTSVVDLDPASGLVLAHVDHWDAAGQFYEKFPLIGPLLRRLRRRLAVPAPRR